MASMVQNASKLGLPTNATLEARILATDMAAVLLSWDARAEAEAAAAAADGVPAAAEGATTTAEGSAAAASSAAVALLAPQASGEKEGSGTPPEGMEAATGDGSAGQAPASRAALVAAAASARWGMFLLCLEKSVCRVGVVCRCREASLSLDHPRRPPGGG